MCKDSLGRVRCLSTVFLGIISIVFYSATCWAFVDYVRPIAFDASAGARGGTTIAIGDDPTSMEVNPALLSETESNALITHLMLIFPDFDYKYTGTGGQRYKCTDKDKLLLAPGMSFAHKVKDSRWSWGLSLAAADAVATDYTVQSKFFGPVSATSNLAHLRFGPALAYQITPKLSIGTRLDIDYSILDLKMPLGLAYLDLGRMDGFGMSASVGLFYKPMKNLSFGVYYETPAVMQDLETGSSDGYLKMMTPGGEVAFGQLDVKAKHLNFPQNYGVGVAYSPIPSLRLSSDLKYINWNKDWDELTLKFSGPGAEGMKNAGVPTTLKVPLSVHNELAFSVGAEYFFNEMYTASVGYHYHDDAVTENYLLPYIPAEMTHTLTCGFSVRPAENVKLALAYMYSFVDDSNAHPIHGYDESLEQQLGMPAGALQSELSGSETIYNNVQTLQISVSLYW